MNIFWHFLLNKLIFSAVKNPEKIFTIFTAGIWAGFNPASTIENSLFLRIDTRKQAESEAQ